MSDKVTLTYTQKNELIEQYVELVVDNMDVKSMMQYITDDLRCHFESVSLNELKDEVDNFDEELFDELVDNVTSESYVDSLLTSGTDYPPLVDTEATHDSEGC
tara:strand:+ start:98 stop:406 length:309 start_codon:yes stop_codon:yes gene_type:complete